MPVFEVSYHLGGSTHSSLQIIKDEVIADSLSCAVKAVSGFIDPSNPDPLIIDKGMCAYIIPKAHILTAKVASKTGSSLTAEVRSGERRVEELRPPALSEAGE